MSRLRWEFAPCYEGKIIYDMLAERANSIQKILLVMGKGFDPSMNTMVHVLLQSGYSGKLDIILLNYARNKTYIGANNSLVEENIANLTNLTDGKANIDEIYLETFDESRSFAGDFRSLQLAIDLGDRLKKYTDVIIDISALPAYISYPFIKESITILETHDINFYVSVGVEPEIDDRVIDVPDFCRYLAGFQSNLELEGSEHLPKIWIPVLGPGRIASIRKLHEYILPLETCPVLPFPSQNPRRPDDILEEYHELLFDPFKVSPKDISYASEFGPLDVYRRLTRLHKHYQVVLEPLCEGLGDSRTVVSPLCSKMLSIGVLLAVIENHDEGMGMANAFGGGHTPLGVSIFRAKSIETRSMTHQMVWILGAPYL